MKKKIMSSFIIVMLIAFALSVISIYAATSVNVSTVSDLQSAHPYSNSMNKTWVYTHSADADKLEITFSNSTKTESNYDYIYILDGENNQINDGYTGTALAGKTVTVPGNVVKIRLTSDSSQTDYGFSVTNIVPIYETGPIKNLEGCVTSKTSMSFSFPAPNEATSVVLEYSTDGDNWDVASTEQLTGSSTTATVNNLEFGVKYWFRLNVIGGEWEGISNVLELTMGYSTAQDFSFTNGTITKYTGSSAFVLIPETIDGMAVTKISESAFSGCSNIAEIIIPDSVTVIGDLAFKDCRSLSSIVVAEDNPNYYSVDGVLFSEKYNALILVPPAANVSDYVIPDSIQRIASYAFYRCSALTSVTIPESVTSIGNYAFGDCTSLEKINYNAVEVNSNSYEGEDAPVDPVDPSDPMLPSDPDGGWVAEEDFSYCLSEDSRVFYNAGTSGPGIEVIFGNSVEKIPSYLFYASDASSSPNIKSVTIGCNVTKIDGGAFYNCVSLEKINYNAVKLSSSLSKKSNVFHNAGKNGPGIEVIFGDSVEEIPAYLFCMYYSSYISPKIKSVTIGKNVTSIGEYAFSGCTPLASITISNSVTSIGKHAFSECISLTSITIPNSVTSIGDGAFEFCTSLTSITIPNSVTSIGAYAFGGCTSLTSITIPNSVTSIGAYAFLECISLTSTTISNSVTSIGDGAFEFCICLTSITIPNSVTTIGEGVFYSCESLEEITLPFIGAKRGITGTVDSVLGYIFGYSTSSESGTTRQYYSDSGSAYYYIPSTLKKVTITDETVIPYGAFYNCANLTDVTIKGNPTAIMAKAFMGHENLWNITIKSKNVRYANGQMFKTTDMPTIYGYEGSTTETYAENYDLWFVALDDAGEEDDTKEYTINADASVVNGKVVLDITTNKPVTDRALHVALYNTSSKLVDYIIVPLNKEYCSFNVVFKDESSPSIAKVFLWDGLESMTPITQAKSVTIKR